MAISLAGRPWRFLMVTLVVGASWAARAYGVEDAAGGFSKVPKRPSKRADLPPLSGYFDVSVTVPLQYRQLALAPPPETGGEVGVAAQRSMIATLELDQPVAPHLRLVARPSIYNTEVLDPLFGLEYERTSRGGWTVTALQSLSLPVSSLSRNSGRVSALAETLRVADQLGPWASYAQLEASYSLFSDSWAQVSGTEHPRPASPDPVPVDQDFVGGGAGWQRFLRDGQWLVQTSASVQRLHFRDHTAYPALWATTLVPFGVTYFTAGRAYFDASLLILRQAKLIIWPDEPLLILGGGVFF